MYQVICKDCGAVLKGEDARPERRQVKGTAENRARNY